MHLPAASFHSYSYTSFGSETTADSYDPIPPTPPGMPCPDRKAKISPVDLRFTRLMRRATMLARGLS